MNAPPSTTPKVVPFPRRSRISGRLWRSLDNVRAFHELQADFEQIERMVPIDANAAAIKARLHFNSSMKDASQ